MSSGTSRTSASITVRITRPISVSKKNDCIALFRRGDQWRCRLGDRAHFHRGAGAADRIGLIVIDDRRLERCVGDHGRIARGAALICAAEPRKETHAAERRVHLLQTCTHYLERVVWQLVTDDFAEGAQDFPVLTRLARWVNGEEASLHASLCVDVRAI